MLADQQIEKQAVVRLSVEIVALSWRIDPSKIVPLQNSGRQK
jgi:hypothetical protein